MTALDSFRNIRSSMLWQGAALAQLDRFQALAERFGAEPKVVGTHTSKSIKLPVMQLSLPAGDFTIRDNFYDLNLGVRLDSPCRLSLAEFFDGIAEPKDWAWYLEQVDKARGYSWREWTDEEILDPRILRVQNKEKTYWSEKRGEEKDRWLKRMTDPTWYTRDWSRAYITYDGVFGPESKLYLQHHAFAEGMDAYSFRYYLPGAKSFILAFDDIETVAKVIDRVNRSV